MGFVEDDPVEGRHQAGGIYISNTAAGEGTHQHPRESFGRYEDDFALVSIAKQGKFRESVETDVDAAFAVVVRGVSGPHYDLPLNVGFFPAGIPEIRLHGCVLVLGQTSGWDNEHDAFAGFDGLAVDVALAGTGRGARDTDRRLHMEQRLLHRRETAFENGNTVPKDGRDGFQFHVITASAAASSDMEGVSWVSSRK